MDASTSSAMPVDFSSIEDPNVRRAMRLMYEDLSSTVKRQQMEIEVLLEMMIDKHVGSISEFKRYLTRLQTAGPKHGRVHEAVASINNAAGPTTAAATGAPAHP